MKIKAAGGRIRNSQFDVPGDKSISHRSMIFGSIAKGETVVRRCLMGADVLATLKCFKDMGANIAIENEVIRIEGVGDKGLSAPALPLDAGNAGTCMRLVSGILAGQPFTSRFVGDHSLSKRPMKRIIEPLERMGAKVESTAAGTAPLVITGRRPLRAITYRLPVPSAQIKSAVLLAGLYADGQTVVEEPEPVRDHTERMLGAFGVRVERTGTRIAITPSPLVACEIDVPGDISSAAFFIVAALIADDCELTLRNVGLNPLRIGILDVLRLMGAQIEITNPRSIGGESVGDLVVRSSDLTGIDVPEEYVSRAIDEFPIIFVAAAFAKGQTRVTGAEELRVKESDRIAAMVNGLVAIGAQAIATPDGAIISGCARARGDAVIATHFDHRIAMAFTIASLRCDQPLVIDEADSIQTSFPTFVEIARTIGMKVETSE